MIFKTLALSTLGTVAVAIPSLAGTWAGKEVTKEGVVHVANPAKPADGSSFITPVELWRAGGDDDEDVLFGVLSAVDVDARGNVYALDVQLSQVNVFSPDGELLRTIGREGEGPGEFRRASHMFLTPEGNVAVMQMMPGKLVLLTPDGKPAGDFNGPKGSEGGTISYFEGAVAGDHYVLGTREFARRETYFSMTRSLLVLDARGQTRATIFRENMSRDMAGAMSVDEKETASLVWAAGDDGRIYTSENFDGYEIKCFSPEGRLLRVIEREYAHRPRSKEEMEENKPRMIMRREGGRAVQPEVKSSPTDRDILRMVPRPDGTLWVLSSRGRSDQPRGVLATFDVFDSAGRFVREVAIRVPADIRQDEFHLIGDQLVLVKSVRSAREAMLAQFGGNDTSPEDEAEPEPVTLVAYRLEPEPTAKR
jgi:hypothetical protein